MGFHRQNQDIFNSKCAYAIERYTGVVYEHLDWHSLNKKAQDFLDKHIYIFSGLFGMVTPKTLIPDYKLKMNVLSLQYHWSPIISEELEKEDLIIDLLPQVHRKAYKKANNVIAIDFQVIKKGKKSAAGHFGKAVKGELIRYIAENQITNIESEIKAFTKLINQPNQYSSNNQIIYDDYNKLQDLLNVKLKAWEQTQNKIDKIKKKPIN